MNNEFKLPRELALLNAQLLEAQHYEAASLVAKRLSDSLKELEDSVLAQVEELKKKLSDAEAKIPSIIDGTDLVVNCTSELNAEVVDAAVMPAATAEVAAAEIKPA